MRNRIENYCNDFVRVINSVRVTGSKKKAVDFYDGIKTAIGLLPSKGRSPSKLIFIGNGGSAAIASHMATDFWKNGGLHSIAFNDSSLLTCISNDYGYRYVFEKPIEMFAGKRDVLFAISSSGKSENILRGVVAAKSKGCKVITLSGFDEKNPLSLTGDLNFYVPSHSYGPVEIAHNFICHCILDIVIEGKLKK